MDRVRGALLRHRYSPRTVQCYTDWILRFIKFHQLRHPGEMAEAEVLVFLTWLAEKRRVAHSTQNAGDECPALPLSRGAGAATQRDPD